MPKRLDASILVVRVLFSTYLINVVFGVILISWHAVSCHVIVTSLGFYYFFFEPSIFIYPLLCYLYVILRPGFLTNKNNDAVEHFLTRGSLKKSMEMLLARCIFAIRISTCMPFLSL